MAEKYAATGAAASGTNKTLINVFNPAVSPTRRARIFELVFGGSGAPVDHQALYQFRRHTALGTEGSGFTPNNIDPAGPGSECDAGVAHSGEPTYTSAKELMSFPLHHRNTFRWIARPGDELIIPATQDNGIGLACLSSTSTQSYAATILFTE